MPGSVRFFGQGRKKSYDERSLTNSKDRTGKKSRTARKKPDRTIKGGVRTAETIGMDKYGGHDHSKATGCTGSCPKYVIPPEE